MVNEHAVAVLFDGCKRQTAPARREGRGSAASKHNGRGVDRAYVKCGGVWDFGRVLWLAEQRGRPAADVDYVTRHLTLYSVYAVGID